MMKVETQMHPYMSLGLLIVFHQRRVELHLLWLIVTVGRDGGRR